MARLFGERWQVSTERPLAVSSQSEILRVVDVRREFEGDYALKRILRPRWHGRLGKEIECISALRHPNVIGLVDAAAFTRHNGSNLQPWVVMPIAGGGDLGERRRTEAYKHSVDWILQVAAQMTSALAAAGTAGMIHRGLKPANVLFTGKGHEIWLADFGASLVREPARPEDTDVWDDWQAFMAPEIEQGSHLEVTPAADVYSLGKILYFMYSGGQNAPHHLTGSSDHNSMFLKGRRCKLLGTLLQDMICPLHNRLKTVPEVEARLDAIARCE
jgi:serine/threonine protein kinase